MKSLMKSVYQKFYSMLPEPWAEPVSEVAFKVAGRPFVCFDHALHPPTRLKKGAITFSTDFEMAWGYQYSRSAEEDCVTIGLREREQVPKILATLNGYDIPITWATVGHLFLASCTRGASGLPHREIPRCGHFDKHWQFTSGDWFQHDPCSDVHKDPAWYAPDLIEAILSSRTHHEMASHSFSHVGFGEYCPEEVAAAEIHASLEAMKLFGLRPKTFVFPGNESGKLNLFAGTGLEVLRLFPVSWAEISLPVKLKEDLWGVHQSIYVETATKNVSLDRHLARLLKFVDKAVESRMSAHFVFHSSLPETQMMGLLFPLLRYCAELREKSLIDIFTMEGLVNETVHAWNR